MAIFDLGYGYSIQQKLSHGQPSRQLVLRQRGIKSKSRSPEALTDDIFRPGLTGVGRSHFTLIAKKIALSVLMENISANEEHC